jgi:glycosyltransferase involved in cell wall biosynthesis
MHTVVMVATSYPRFPGDHVGSFMEPIARSVAARGHEVHLVAPWHPLVRRPPLDAGVRLHYFKYAPLPSLNVFGYAGALREDVQLRRTAYLVAPFALVAGWRLARRVARSARATVMHGHWVIPGGAIAAWARPALPLVVSLHGSDVFVAERQPLARAIARRVFRKAGWVTACSADLADRALRLGARPDRLEVVPYGVDVTRFRPEPALRARVRSALGLGADTPMVFAAGRFVRKKGFEYLVDAAALLGAERPGAVVVIGGAGDLDQELRRRAVERGVSDVIRFPGLLTQDAVADALAAADVAVVPSVRDEAGNVDGLPNVVMEALASGTPLVTTAAGGIGSVVCDGETALVVAERDPAGLAEAISRLLHDKAGAAAMGAAAREQVVRRHGWDGVAARLEAAYDRAVAAGRRARHPA